jgi:hypothetical protein
MTCFDTFFFCWFMFGHTKSLSIFDFVSISGYSVTRKQNHMTHTHIYIKKWGGGTSNGFFLIGWYKKIDKQKERKKKTFVRKKLIDLSMIFGFNFGM